MSGLHRGVHPRRQGPIDTLLQATYAPKHLPRHAFEASRPGEEVARLRGERAIEAKPITANFSRPFGSLPSDFPQVITIAGASKALKEGHFGHRQSVVRLRPAKNRDSKAPKEAPGSNLKPAVPEQTPKRELPAAQ